MPIVCGVLVCKTPPLKRGMGAGIIIPCLVYESNHYHDKCGELVCKTPPLKRGMDAGIIPCLV